VYVDWEDIRGKVVSGIRVGLQIIDRILTVLFIGLARSVKWVAVLGFVVGVIAIGAAVYLMRQEHLDLKRECYALAREVSSDHALVARADAYVQVYDDRKQAEAEYARIREERERWISAELMRVDELCKLNGISLSACSDLRLDVYDRADAAFGLFAPETPAKGASTSKPGAQKVSPAI
jgi:hypothetical protein